MERWCAARGRSVGAVITLGTAWALARSWYVDRLDPRWRRRTAVEAQTVFTELLQAIASALRPARNGDLDFIPTGGVTLANMKSWKATGCVAAVGGTWLAKESLVISRAKAGIVAATREALACWNTPA